MAIMAYTRFNPLNQVYVFNPDGLKQNSRPLYRRFNPLNQVYVFNCYTDGTKKIYECRVLIP